MRGEELKGERSWGNERREEKVARKERGVGEMRGERRSKE